MLQIREPQMAVLQEEIDRDICRQLTENLKRKRPTTVSHWSVDELEAACFAALQQALQSGLNRGPLALVFMLSRFIPSCDLDSRASLLTGHPAQQPTDPAIVDGIAELVNGEGRV